LPCLSKSIEKAGRFPDVFFQGWLFDAEFFRIVDDDIPEAAAFEMILLCGVKRF
jgi:hypothetical protein